MKERLLRESKILQAVHRLSQKREKEVYLVGGTIRDLLLERPWGRDLDFVTSGEASNLAKDLATEAGGQAFSLNDSFGTWRVVLKRGKSRTEVDFSPMQGINILEDLRQRDFTVNSMGMDLEEIFHQETPSLIDPLDGLSDLHKKVLRANSEDSLGQDPLRMLRAFRFSATLRLKIEEETLEMIQRNKRHILRSAWERIRSEFFTGLNGTRAGRFFRGLHQSGLLEEIFPEIKEWGSLDQGNHHDFSLLEHSFRTVEAGEFIFRHFQNFYPSYGKLLAQHFSEVVEEAVSRRALFKFVAFFHDSGKPESRSVNPEGLPIVRFLDHDQQGQRINIAIAQRMKLSRKSIRILSELTRQHMRILSLSKTEKVTPRALYRFFRDLGKVGIDAAFLALADSLGSRKILLGGPWLKELPSDIKRVKEVADELLSYYYEEFSLKPVRPFLDGREIMEAFGLSQGEKVGTLLARLREAEITGMVRTKEEALEFLKNLDNSRPFS
jgi:poly(A) polymerase